MNYKIFPLGDCAATVEFDNKISVEANNQVLALANFLDANSFSGLIEIVPAYASLSVFYDVVRIRRKFPDARNAFEIVENFLQNVVRNLDVSTEEKNSRLVEIPVCFDAEFAPDLEFVAASNNLSIEKVLEIFLARAYRVYMLGFLPGFAYMGEVDERIAAPRKDAPRLQVPKGSVGIAGRQTGIYSLESPGGWQIIGRANIELFTPEAASPTFLQAGDTVRFYKADF